MDINKKRRSSAIFINDKDKQDTFAEYFENKDNIKIKPIIKEEPTIRSLLNYFNCFST